MVMMDLAEDEYYEPSTIVHY